MVGSHALSCAVSLRPRRSDGVPAGVRSAGWLASRRADAGPGDAHHGRTRMAAIGSLSIGSSWKAVRTSSANSPTASTPCSRGSKHTSPNSKDDQRLPRTTHPTGDHADTSRRRAQRSGPRHRRTRRPPPRRQHPSDRPHRSIAPAQPHRPTVLHPRTHRPIPRSRRTTETLLPLAEARRRRRDLRAPEPTISLPRVYCCRSVMSMVTERDRPQPARARAQSGSRPAFTPRVRCSPSRTPARSSPHSQLPRSPSRFFAAPNGYAPTTQLCGVGLGLAMVESITQAHDGDS